MGATMHIKTDRGWTPFIGRTGNTFDGSTAARAIKIKHSASFFEANGMPLRLMTDAETSDDLSFTATAQEETPAMYFRRKGKDDVFDRKLTKHFSPGCGCEDCFTLACEELGL
jgi:hypothetical protein